MTTRELMERLALELESEALKEAEAANEFGPESRDGRYFKGRAKGVAFAAGRIRETLAQHPPDMVGATNALTAAVREMCQELGRIRETVRRV